MANYAYTHIYYHLVISPQLLCPLENSMTRQKVYHHIAEILRANKNRVLAINGAFDHVHIFYGVNPYLSSDDLVSEIKKETKKFISENGLIPNFEWQEGYAAVTVGLSEVKKLIAYIRNQVEFHQTTSFREEYIRLLEENGIEYDQKDLFTFHQ